MVSVYPFSIGRLLAAATPQMQKKVPYIYNNVQDFSSLVFCFNAACEKRSSAWIKLPPCTKNCSRLGFVAATE